MFRPYKVILRLSAIKIPTEQINEDNAKHGSYAFCKQPPSDKKHLIQKYATFDVFHPKVL